MSTAEITRELFTFLDEHRDLIRYAKKGYIAKLCSAFKEKCGHDKSPRWMAKNLYTYRIVREVPIEYCENKYYTSAHKIKAQSPHETSDEASKSE